MHRGALLLCLLLTPLARGQEPDWRDVESTQEADRIELVRGAPPAAPAGLGGLAGAVRGRYPEALPPEDLIVLTSGPDADARVVVRISAEREGRVERQVYDLRAERIALFLERRADPLRPARQKDVPRALYAEGQVRLAIEDNRHGSVAAECSRAWLDVRREEAFLEQVELRALPRPGSLSIPSLLGGRVPVIRAGWIRMHGLQRAVAEEATLTACELGDPHWLVAARRLELRREEDATLPPRGLLAGLLEPQRATPGSDALRRELTIPRWVRAEGTAVELLGWRTPELPLVGWNTEWPFPRIRAGHSSRLGVIAGLGLRYEVARAIPLGPLGALELEADTQVDHFSRRGTGGEQGLFWRRLDDADGDRVGSGHFKAFGIDDRARLDRVGTPIETEHRFWLRGLVREPLPGGGQLDGELSRISDRGLLLEYFRTIAQTDKEQETYLFGRWSWDALSYRALARFRLNDFQTQVERLPEVRLDWIHLPLYIAPAAPWGGFYLDLTARAGHLRFRPDDATGLDSYRAGRADVVSTLSWKTSLGPFVVRAFGTARETVWSGRAGDDDDAIDRFLGEAGWNVSTTLWREFDTPWTVLRHEVVPEVGTRHRYDVGRDPSELLLFDELETFQPTDHLFLRVRNRLKGDQRGRRRTLADLSVEARFFPRDRGLDQARRWGALLWDLRLSPVDWMVVRVRADQELNRGALLSLDASATVRPIRQLEASVAYREREASALTPETRALSWGVLVRLTDSWAVEVQEQYDFQQDDFLRHQARVIRYIHCLAIELTISHDPQQDDTSASVAVALAPSGPGAADPFDQDRYRELYR